MEGESCHGGAPQTHDVTQHQSLKLLSDQAVYLEEL